MVEENDNRLNSVMREVVKNSDQYIEQMLIYDLLRRNHLETYLRSTLRQIESSLDKSVDKFIQTSEYKQAKGLFQEKEMEYQSWSENFGNQVRVKEENLRLLEKAAKEKKMLQEKQKQKQAQSEWNQKIPSNGAKEDSGVRRKKKKDKRGKRGKNKGGRGVVRKWVETNDSKVTRVGLNQSAWLMDDVTDKKRKDPPDAPKAGTELANEVSTSLANYNVSCGGRKEPFADLPRQKRYILRPLPSDCFISNISFSFYDKELPQGGPKNLASSTYILENLDRLFTPEKQNLVFEIGEELRPENLLPGADDLPIETEDFLTPAPLDCTEGLFAKDFPFYAALEEFLTVRARDEVTLSAMSSFLRAFAPNCTEEMIRWLLQKNGDDHVDVVIDFLVVLRSVNPAILDRALVILCCENPVRLFNIHVMFKLQKQNINASPELMNQFVRSWFQYCNQNLEGEEKGKHQQSMKKILAGFVKNTVSTGNYDLELLCREVDEFCSKNANMASVRKMKQVIDERQKSHQKRRK